MLKLSPFRLLKKNLTLVRLGGLLILLMAGCAAIPKTLQVQGLDQGFSVDTIVASQTRSAIPFDRFVDELMDVPLVFIGEIHSSSGHHARQLKLTREIFKQRPRLSVGMEMFDRSYQPVLDLWRQGNLDTDQFIRKTHWYANWRFDFALYREIVTFIQENQIPLIGLDLPTYIPARLRVGGIESLSPADRDWLPPEIPAGDSDHRAFMEKTFKQHHFLGRTTSFENFYMAQCARDASMAYAIADSLGGGPMVVLIGNGHIRHGSGVPQRVQDYTGKSFKTVYLAPVGEEVSLDIADYIWVTPEVAPHPRMR